MTGLPETVVLKRPKLLEIQQAGTGERESKV
jgi:hypothetical protein